MSVVDLTSSAPTSAPGPAENSVVSPLKLSFSPDAGIAEMMTAEESAPEQQPCEKKKIEVDLVEVIELLRLGVCG